MRLVVGLGNPGPRYQNTRHNVGFRAVDSVGDELNVSISKQFRKSLTAAANYDGEKIILAKPQCYMNRSGLAAAELLSYYKIAAHELVVIYDDMDLPPGKIRIRIKGGAGGHRGLASIINEIGTRDFCRVKIGIGRPPENMSPTDHVLSKFHGEEREAVEAAVLNARDAVFDIISVGPDKAMNKFNIGDSPQE